MNALCQIFPDSVLVFCSYGFQCNLSNHSMLYEMSKYSMIKKVNSLSMSQEMSNSLWSCAQQCGDIQVDLFPSVAILQMGG